MSANLAECILALRDGLIDGGVEHSLCYPGFHANELHEALEGGDISINEKTAYSMAWGCSLAGSRTVVSFKNVGLNDAADPFLASHQLGCNGGLVLALFEDCDIQHSQNRMDSRPYFHFCGGLWLEPASLQQAYDWARKSFLWSESCNTPVVIRVTNSLYNKKGTWLRGEGTLGNCQWKREPQRWVAHPVNAAIQEAQQHERNLLCADIAEQLFLENLKNIPGAMRPNKILGGTPREISVRESLLINMLPLPLKGLKQAKLTGGLTVYENGQPFISKELNGASNEMFTPGSLNNRRLRYKYRITDRYERFLGAMRRIPSRWISGDLGEYTMDPSKTIDACLCYGASVAVAAGMAMAAQRHDKRVFVLTGDGSFCHSGWLAYREALHRKLSITVVVFDNGGLYGTGRQQIPLGLQGIESMGCVGFMKWNESDLFEQQLGAPMSGPRLIIIKEQ